MIKIPIEMYEKDIDLNFSKEKKSEIFDLFTKSNKLCSEGEYIETQRYLYEACKQGDIDLIKICLSETIQAENSQNFFYKINRTTKTASLFKVNSNINQLNIPRTVEHESTEYLITSITGTNCTIKTVTFAEDSAVDTIYFGALSQLEEIQFPPSLKKLKKGWCKDTIELTKIIISPSNDQFIFKDGKYLLGKTNPNTNEFDNLIFVIRSIKDFSIPSNIKVISPYAFYDCFNLEKVEIPPNSNLQIIGSNAFSGSSIKEIFIPPTVTEICELAFAICSNLKKVKIHQNSNLKTIETFAFQELPIEEIFIPPKVSKLSENVFSSCLNLTKIDIPPNSNLQLIEPYAFYETGIEEIYFPASLKELKNGWCCETKKLKKIIISPSNDQFRFIENKYLVGKTDPNSDDFDILYFVNRDIKEISIPSNIKVISSFAFENCTNLKKVDFSPNSNLQTIELFAFSGSSIKNIFIPPKVSKLSENVFRSCQDLTKIDIPPNSNLQTIETNAFFFSEIDEIYFPASLKELKNGWCCETKKLKKIIISPSNDQFRFIENKYLVGKTDPNSDDFDILYFVNRDIKEISIPSNIKVISSFAFDNCTNLTKVDFSPNSNLQTIESKAFSYSNIIEIIIPPKVSKICEDTFYACENLTKVDFSPNSNLQIIESGAFSYLYIQQLLIPSKVSKICEYAFPGCSDLKIVEIQEDSELESFPWTAFSGCENAIIMIPSSCKPI